MTSRGALTLAYETRRGGERERGRQGARGEPAPCPLVSLSPCHLVSDCLASEIPIPETVPQVAQAGEGALAADVTEVAIAEGQDEIANAIARQHARGDDQAAWFAAPHSANMSRHDCTCDWITSRISGMEPPPRVPSMTYLPLRNKPGAGQTSLCLPPFSGTMYSPEIMI